jgi:hypothetical protein
MNSNNQCMKNQNIYKKWCVKRQLADTRPGYLLIELTMGIFLFTISLLSCAFIIATAYSCYQEGALYCQAATVLQQQLSAVGSHTLPLVPGPFAVTIVRKALPHSNLNNSIFAHTNQHALEVVTVTWRGAGRQRSLSGIRMGMS